jgi:hypothetical protein
MLAAVVCAVLCGARGYRAIAQWIHLQDPETWHWLGFTRRPASANCFRDLLMALAPDAFEEALGRWSGSLSGVPADHAPLQAVSIDGKTLCGTLQPHARAIHLLSALDQRTGCVLSQRAVDEKTNEAKAALGLLKGLVLRGRVVIGDAMFCQREICAQVLADGGHYLFVVKDNQPTLLREIEAAFANEAAFSPLGPAGIPRIATDGRDAEQGARPDRAAAAGQQHDPQ